MTRAWCNFYFCLALAMVAFFSILPGLDILAWRLLHPIRPLQWIGLIILVLVAALPQLWLGVIVGTRIVLISDDRPGGTNWRR
jgi:hypothetical protein